MGLDREEASRCVMHRRSLLLPGKVWGNSFSKSCASWATRRDGKIGIERSAKEERRTTNVKSKRGIGSLWSKVIALGR